MPTPRFDRIRANPSLYPGVADDLGPAFSWHTHAGSPRSSQALCLSAWAPLRRLESRHAVIDALLAASLPAFEAEAAPPAGRHWGIGLEAGDPGVLHERGGRASSIDVLLEAGDAVVCVESKFLRDAAVGFRGCGQYPSACRGFYGPGSDRTGGTAAPCRLAVAETGREPRIYWQVAARAFRPELLEAVGGEPGSCPLHRYYQLARNLLFAARAAELSGRALSAALVIVPRACAAVLESQAAAFTREVLLPEHAGRVAVVHYELLVRLLEACGDPEAAAVGAFVAGLLPRPAPPARSATARELRRRAEGARHGHAARRVEPARRADVNGCAEVAACADAPARTGVSGRAGPPAHPDSGSDAAASGGVA